MTGGIVGTVFAGFWFEKIGLFTRVENLLFSGKMVNLLP